MGRWKEHLAFNKKERFGTIVLCLLLLSVSLLRASWDRFFPPSYPDVDFALIADQQVEPKGPEKTKEFSITKSNNAKKDPSRRITQTFYPNQISIEEWIELGFSLKQASAIVKYRESKGGFYSASDVGSSFVITEEKLAQLLPWMSFEQKPQEAFQMDEKEVIAETVAIDLNEADSLDLLSIRGIGPFYAKSIMQLRSDLGGFSTYDQLLTLYGMDSSKLASMEKQTTLNQELVMVRNINSLTTKQLASHPYIDYNLARAIVKFREQHGEYQEFEALLKVHLMNDSILSIIRPFFAVHD